MKSGAFLLPFLPQKDVTNLKHDRLSAIAPYINTVTTVVNGKNYCSGPRAHRYHHLKWNFYMKYTFLGQVHYHNYFPISKGISTFQISGSSSFWICNMYTMCKFHTRRGKCTLPNSQHKICSNHEIILLVHKSLA